ncbi:MAG: radical SAM protein [Prevotella sp.]|nr:radical SAM protein [Prevotella sp.]
MKTYRINEIFYSLQGEGRHTGRAAVFVRFSGCNLRCPFCDTDFKSYRELTAAQIVAAVSQWRDCGFIVLTGGEPSLQVDEALVDALHREGFYIAIETNGTCALPAAIDWVTLSPKSCFVDHAPALAAQKVDEVKVVFDGIHDPSSWATSQAHYLNLQPCDTGNAERNREVTRQCVEYIKQHPQWHLSLQTHKFIHIQ